MKYLWILCLLATHQVSAKSIEVNFDKFKLHSGVSVDVVEGENIKSRVVGLNLGIDIEDKINDYFDYFFQASLELETGSNEVIGLVSEFEPNEGISLDAGGISFNAFNALEMRVGAINQGEYRSPLLIDSTAFAAADQRLYWGPVYIKALQGVPSNNKLSKRLGSVETGTPFFGMETIGIKLGKKSFFKAEVSHFKFKDLSSNIAIYSRTLGNSVTGTSEANSEFNYEFEGTNAFMSARYMFGKFGLLLSGQYLYNDKAPEDRNRGSLVNVGLKYKYFQIHGESFHNESDSSPAFYNSKYYGHNNTRGNALSVVYHDRNYYFDTRFAQIEIIEENNLQSDFDILSLNFYKKY